MDVRIGSLVQVPFHGRGIRGWVLGSAEEVPAHLLPVNKVLSPVAFFDGSMLELLRWVSERYVAPLAVAIARSHPPRVVSEERADLIRDAGGPGVEPSGTSSNLLAGYRNGSPLHDALRSAGGVFVVRPAPEEEVDLAVEAVATCLASGRRAIVLVPEASPVPATARAISRTFGERVGVFLGGDRRARYRRWLEIRAGRFDVVVGTRPAVFAPARDVGLLFVSRESHQANREDRAPYYHVRDVAIERARIGGAVCVLSALCPSLEAAAASIPEVSPATRRWPPVEVVRPGPEGRAPRLVRVLRETRRGFLLSPTPGAGVAQVCRSCGRPAACAACGGLLRMEEGTVACVVCEAPGRCAACGAADFGIRRGGAERVEAWASGVATVPVRRVTSRGGRLPGPREILVGGFEAVRDLGPGGLDLVAVLDADLAEQRSGLNARSSALATWMEAIGWARPGGRAIVQTDRLSDPAIQALVRGNPDRFHAGEIRRRDAAGFPVGAAVFRIGGTNALADELATLQPITLLVSSTRGQTVCLLALGTDRLPAFGRLARELATRDVVTRVEAEPYQ
jgi:primosomal protein N' (replication factor Y)